MIEIKLRCTLEGFTYEPGQYEVVTGNDAGPGQVTERIAEKMLHDGLASRVVAPEEPVKGKPAKTTRKLDDTK